MMGIAFRHSAGFGKRMEYNLVCKMLMEGLDVYLPLVDDHGVDCVIKKEDGTFIEVQIKARSSEVTDGDAALFAAISHELTPNFYFVFYSERLDLMWIWSYLLSFTPKNPAGSFPPAGHLFCLPFFMGLLHNQYLMMHNPGIIR